MIESAAVTYRIAGFSMTRRRARRRLVVVTYGVLALVCGAAVWVARSAPVASTYAVYAAVAVGVFVFGGQGRYGLIKQFGRSLYGRAPAAEMVALQLEAVPARMEKKLWQNDERELRRRDAAHYVAFQPLAVGWFVSVLLSGWALHPPRFLPLNAILRLNVVVALFAAVLAVTLPAAIILWTEPDIHGEEAEA